jgi:hypothetical protein
MVLHIVAVVHFFYTNIQMKVRGCLPHMWGYMWGYKVMYVRIFLGVPEKINVLPGKPVFHGLPGRTTWMPAGAPILCG